MTQHGGQGWPSAGTCESGFGSYRRTVLLLLLLLAAREGLILLLSRLHSDSAITLSQAQTAREHTHITTLLRARRWSSSSWRATRIRRRSLLSSGKFGGELDRGAKVVVSFLSFLLRGLIDPKIETHTHDHEFFKRRDYQEAVQ